MTSFPDRHGASGAAPPNPVSVELSELARARHEAVNVVQWLARVAQSYVTSGPPERRTDLNFRVEKAAFQTKPFANGVALEMRLPDLRLQFLQNSAPVPHVFDPQERSPAEAEAWILVELLHRGIDREKFFKNLPYAVPGLLTGDAQDYAPEACSEGLAELTLWFGRAAALLKDTARACVAENQSIICLPQTLDLVLGPSPTAKSVSLGFSLGDAQHPEPYFYTAAATNSAASANPHRAVVRASALFAENEPGRAAAMLLKIASV
jgi:hypothetical protein